MKNSLIKQAVIGARNKADIAASVLGLKVKSVNFNELDQSPPAPQPLAMRAKLAPTASATPIIAGQQELSVNVRIDWLIS